MQPFIPTTTKICPSFDIGDFIIREQQESDIEAFFHYYTKPEVCRFILCQMPKTIEEARSELLYWRNCFYRNDGVYYAIADKKDNRMIGSIGLTSYNPYQRRIELSYDLDSNYWRQGIISKAVKVMIKHAFDYWKVNRIEASVYIDNTPSKDLLSKQGFITEGVLRQHRYHLGKFVDVHFMSLLKDDISKGAQQD